MKYIHLEYAGYVIFDKAQKHSDIASKFPKDNVLSAGFVNLNIEGEEQVQCHGESTSLRKSVDKEDEKWIYRRLSIYA